MEKLFVENPSSNSFVIKNAFTLFTEKYLCSCDVYMTCIEKYQCDREVITTN